eukprot:4098805-Ditylum_brightwellii.AAC.2
MECRPPALLVSIPGFGARRVAPAADNSTVLPRWGWLWDNCVLLVHVKAPDSCLLCLFAVVDGSGHFGWLGGQCCVSSVFGWTWLVTDDTDTDNNDSDAYDTKN